MKLKTEIKQISFLKLSDRCTENVEFNSTYIIKCA